jgi:hypothetical protein
VKGERPLTQGIQHGQLFLDGSRGKALTERALERGGSKSFSIALVGRILGRGFCWPEAKQKRETLRS